MSIQGKIYGIMSPSLFKVYIGSTSRRLTERLRSHVKYGNKYVGGKKCTSKSIIQQGDYKMFLIENYICNTKEELLRREGEWIKVMMGSGLCVNRLVAGRTQEERRNDPYLKSKYKDRAKESRETCPTYQISLAKRLVWKSKSVICDCGSTVTNGNLASHRRSLKHQAWVSSQGSQDECLET